MSKVVAKWGNNLAIRISKAWTTRKVLFIETVAHDLVEEV